MKVTREDRTELRKVLQGLGREKTKREVFYDLCFCICAPQTTFKNNTKVIKELKKRKFYNHDVIDLKQILRPVRFYNNKAKYLLAAKEGFDLIYEASFDEVLETEHKRDVLVRIVKGMGMKAASHYLRNLGHEELAIIDTHVIKFLASTYKGQVVLPLLESYKRMATTKNGYKELEALFEQEADDRNLTVAELDALVWKNYSNTSWGDFKY